MEEMVLLENYMNKFVILNGTKLIKIINFYDIDDSLFLEFITQDSETNHLLRFDYVESLDIVNNKFLKLLEN